MKKIIFAALFCLAAVCGVQAQENPMKYNGLVMEYKGDDAQAKAVVEALQSVLPDVEKAFGWQAGRETISIDYSGEVVFTSGEKKTTGQIFVFDQGTESMRLGASMSIARKSYDLNVDTVAHADMKYANLIFNNQDVINVVSQVVPNAEQNDALMKIYGAVSMYPDVKIGMKIAIDLASMMQ
jgi:hypothetical protein